MNVILSPGMVDEPTMTVRKPNVGTFRVDFNGATVGLFDVDADGGYVWTVKDAALDSHFPKSRYSALPATIHNLHPDLGIFGQLLHVDTKEGFIGTGIKCLSGIRVFPMADKLKGEFIQRGQSLDIRASALANVTSTDGAFTGTYAEPQGMAGTPEFNQVLADQWVGRFNHRFSGKQTKMPGFLNGEVISPAVDRLPFTHFIKYPSAGGREGDGVLEWAGLRMARATGIKVNDFALVPQGDKLPPAIVVERFDIPHNAEDLQKEWLLLQDFYSIMGEDPMNDSRDRSPLLFRYDDLLSGWIKYCDKNDPASTEKNAKAFLTRMFTSWAANDADLHAKNMSTLINIDPHTKQVKSVEFSPAYDICTSTLCGTDGEPMYYNLNRKKGQAFEGNPPRVLNMNDFMDFLKSPKLSVEGKPFCVFDTADEAKSFIRDIASKVAYEAVECCKALPAMQKDSEWGPLMNMEMQHLAVIALKRAKSIGADVPDVIFDPRLNKAIQKYGAKARRDAYDRSGMGIQYRDIFENGTALTRDIAAPVVNTKPATPANAIPTQGAAARPSI